MKKQKINEELSLREDFEKKVVNLYKKALRRSFCDGIDPLTGFMVHSEIKQFTDEEKQLMASIINGLTQLLSE